MKQSIPKTMQAIFWSKDVAKLDVVKDKTYIIHQVLNYGDLRSIRWVQKLYGKEEVKRVFSRKPKKIYEKAIFYFVKEVILGLKGEPLKPRDYVKISP